MKRKMKRLKEKAAVAIATATAMMTSTANASVLGQSSSQAVNTGYQEIFGLAEILGLAGVAICGLLIFIKKADIAKTVAISVVVGFLILKYAEPIWNLIRGGV